jgi:hypothetical protein
MLYYYYDQTGKLLNTVELPQDPYNPSGWTKNPPTERPAEFIEGKSICLFNTASNKWEWFTDYGVVYDKLNCQNKKDVPIGYVLQTNDTLHEPIKDEPFQLFDFANDCWVVDTDSKTVMLRNRKINESNALCKTLIESGFTSDATGTVYKYDSELEDQSNLQGSVILADSTGQPVPYLCWDSNEHKVQVLHTPAQLEKVLQDGSVRLLYLLTRNNQNKVEIASLGYQELVNYTPSFD